MTPNRTLALAKPKPKTNWFEFCLVLFRVNWNTDWEKKYEYGRTQFGGLLELEEAGQEPLLPIGTHHAFLLVQKFSISKLCCEFICSFQLNFMHGNCWPYCCYLASLVIQVVDRWIDARSQFIKVLDPVVIPARRHPDRMSGRTLRWYC